MLKGQKFELDAETPYQKWVRGQNIPVLREFYIEDLSKVDLAPWEWKGGRGAYLNLIGTGDVNDGYLCEIPPGESLKPQRVLFEEMIYVIEGNGATSIWNDENKKVTFEWQAGSLFSPPANTWRQHFNGHGSKPARFLAVTSAPPLINLFRNLDFILNNPFSFDDRFDADPESYAGKGETFKNKKRTVLDTNFIPDLRTLELFSWAERGAGGSNIMIELAENSMGAHVSEFPVGTYKKAHRHGAGAHVIILSGEGYSLMWPEGESPKRFDWHDGSVVVPPENWFHQHFNTGATPARYLALRASGTKFHHAWGAKNGGIDESVKEGGNQIEYEDEDPEIRAMFERDLARNGVVCRMAPVNRAISS
jgi:quercetin dioxygenase-like cupin family protein